MLDAVQATIAMKHYQKKLREARKLISSLRTQLSTARLQLEAARKDLQKAEEVEFEIEQYLDSEVHPNYPYDHYLTLMDSVRSVVDWEYADTWKEE